MKYFAFIFAFPFLVQAASFDCSKAVSVAEKLICSSTLLGQLDDDLSAAYKEAKNGSEADLSIDQKKWLKNIRNKCADEKCLETAYRTRIAELKSWNELIAPTKDIYGNYWFDQVPAEINGKLYTDPPDCLTLSKDKSGLTAFTLVTSRLGTLCEVKGKLRLSDTTYQYVPKSKAADDDVENDLKCKLQIKVRKRSLDIEDPDGECSHTPNCGYGVVGSGYVDGAKFLRTKKSAKQCKP